MKKAMIALLLATMMAIPVAADLPDAYMSVRPEELYTIDVDALTEDELRIAYSRLRDVYAVCFQAYIDESSKNAELAKPASAPEPASTPTPAPKPTSTPTPVKDSAGEIESSIRSHVRNTYKDTDIDSITVNNNSIALVHLKWNVKNTAGTTKEMLKMYSDDLAATIAGEYKGLTEIAVFWKVPYLSSDCKWHYECKNGNAFMDDSMINF